MPPTVVPTVVPTAALTAEPVVPELLTSPQAEALGSQPGRLVLPRLISVPPATFASDYWGHRALLSTATELGQPFDDLLGPDAVDELLSVRGLRTPFLRVAKAGSTLGDKAFTAPGGVGATIGDQVSDDKLVRLFAEGSTLVLQALHRVWPPVLALCQQLAAELGHPVQANAYVTPPQNQGFSNHYDVHDVFVLQIEGEKRWIIHSPVLESPLRDQPWSDRRAAVEQRAQERPLLETVLRPGDCLYLPRGFLHAAQALGGVSTHLTIGVHTWTGFHLAEQLMGQALRTVAQRPDVRSSLAVGTSFSDGREVRDDVERVRAALLEAVRQVDPEQLAATMQQQALNSSRAAPVGPLRQLREASTLSPDERVQLREHLEATLDTTAQGRVLRSRAGALELSEAEVAGVKSLLGGGSVAAAELGVDLARRLMLAGLAVLA
ncbi:MAG TPA: cupin domain-containing protein [Propionibacteriaceae bacterium]|nr:cupin domain-containing protein [Propionibacteriaceae bacterium]